MDIQYIYKERAMGATTHVSRWGSSLAVRIPKALAEQWGVEEGSAIELAAEGDDIVLRKRSYDLADLVADMSPANAHPEVDWGEPQGDEVW